MMSEITEDIELRSEEVQEILSDSPPWLAKSGTTHIFLIIIIVITASFFIKYPDIINGKIIITTRNPPIKIVSKINGKVINLYKKDGDSVKIGELIAEIENPLSQAGVKYLEQLLQEARIFLNNPTINLEFRDDSYVFGEIQTSYHELKRLSKNYAQWINDPFTKQEIEILHKKISQYKDLIFITQKQSHLASEELVNGEVKYATDKKLYEDGVISKMSFYQEESAYRQKKQAANNLESSLTQQKITLTDLQKQLLELEHNYREKKRRFTEDLKLNIDAIKNHIEAWGQNYLIKTSINGKLSYLKEINEQQFLKSGEFVFAILPYKNEFLGIMTLSSKGFGKVKIGQDVRIKLDNYPAEQYGYLKGYVKSSSQLAHEGYYRIEIQLKNEMASSYGYSLEYLPEMSGNAEIITEDLRLFERIFYELRRILKR